jgi:predicted RNA-binding protein YlxR (DUF448 family)
LKKVSPKSKPARRLPQRTCIICRQTSGKRTLVRIVRTASDGIQIDERGKIPGRGAYLCHDSDCWHRALGSTALQQALRTDLTPEEQVLLTEYAGRFTIKQRSPMENSQ